MAGDGDLVVRPGEVSKYGMDMQLLSGSAQASVGTKLAPVNADSAGAFSGLSAIGSGVFAEGPVMQAAMEKQLYAFESFVRDLTNGLQAIGSAANVCAYAYNAIDVESADKMNVLEGSLFGYAFATDPDAKAPSGLPKEVTGETLLDQQQARQGAEIPEAVANPNGGTTANIFNGGYLTTYSDGSSKMVQSQPDPGALNGAVMVTTITAPGGQVLSTTTTKTTYSGSGTASEYYRQEVTPSRPIEGTGGTPQKTAGSTVTTETTGKVDGGKTIKTTTEVGGRDPQVTYTDVPPPSTAKVDDAGPLQKAQEELGMDAGKIDWRKGYQGVQAPG